MASNPAVTVAYYIDEEEMFSSSDEAHKRYKHRYKLAPDEDYFETNLEYIPKKAVEIFTIDELGIFK